MLRGLHRWVGLLLALPLLIQGLTGTLLLVLPLVVGRPAAPAADRSFAATATIAQQIASATTRVPAGLRAVRYQYARWPGDSALVGFAPPGRRELALSVPVDPRRLTAAAPSHLPVVMGWLERLHTDLLLLPLGRSATGVMGVLLLGMAITGVMLWWPHPTVWRDGRWRRTVVVSRRARGHRLWRELHVATGFWSALVLVFMSGSGALLAFPASRGWFGTDRTGAMRTVVHPVGADRWDDAVAALHLLLPDATPTDLALGPGGVRVRATSPASSSTLTVQVGRDGTARLSQGGPDAPSGARAFQWMHLLHEGRLRRPGWLAAIWLAVLALVGLALAGFACSGVAMWILRRRKPLRTRQAVRPAASPS